MRKFIGTLAGVILLALMGIFGLNYLKKNGPRERVDAPGGGKIVVEEMSYYIHGSKIFGRLYKPGDESGNFPDSLGPLPLVIYFHEPLKTDFPETVVKSLVPKGMIGYVCGFRGKAKDAAALVKRIRGEKFVSPDQVFVVSDASCCNEIVNAVAKIGSKVQGLVLIEPSLNGKASETYFRHSKEFLTIDAQAKPKAVSLIEDYLEERGALK